MLWSHRVAGCSLLAEGGGPQASGERGLAALCGSVKVEVAVCTHLGAEKLTLGWSGAQEPTQCSHGTDVLAEAAVLLWAPAPPAAQAVEARGGCTRGSVSIAHVCARVWWGAPNSHLLTTPTSPPGSVCPCPWWGQCPQGPRRLVRHCSGYLCGCFWMTLAFKSKVDEAAALPCVGGPYPIP